MKWKYVKKQEKRYDQYISIQAGEPKTMLITGWHFNKNPYTEAIFFADVLEENGEKVSKVWSVWDKKLRDDLKKKLSKFKPDTDKVKIKITMKTKDAVDTYTVRILKS